MGALAPRASLFFQCLAMVPVAASTSEHLRRQVLVDFWLEASSTAMQHTIGTGNIMWEADFPHPTPTYPHSRKAVETSLSGVPGACNITVDDIWAEGSWWPLLEVVGGGVERHDGTARGERQPVTLWCA